MARLEGIKELYEYTFEELANMEIVYLYDGTPFVVYQDGDGENVYPMDEWTKVPPTPGIYQPFYFDGAKWIGSTKEEWEANNPVIIMPSDIETLRKMLGMTNVQIMTMRKEIEELKGSL